MPEAEEIPRRLGRLIASPKAYAKQKTLLAGLRWLRANLPLGRVETEGFDPFWVVTRHADVSDIIRQHVCSTTAIAHTRSCHGVGRYALTLTGGSPHPTTIRRIDPTFDAQEFGTKFLSASDLDHLRDGLRKAGLWKEAAGADA
jgi:hypothetical protein